MPLSSFDHLFRQADARRQPVPVAVAGAADRTVLEALRTGCDRGWVAPQSIGPEAEIRRVTSACQIGLQGFAILDAGDAAALAVAQVRSGAARILMKGQIATPDLMRAVLDPESGLRIGRVICQVALMEIPRDERAFLLADTGICIQPTLDQKIDILRSAVAVARVLGEDRPQVAVMAATEKATELMPDTLDAAELQRRNQAGEWPTCVVRGPLSFDLAYSTKAADKKHLSATPADVMLFPNLLSANLTVKAIMYTADCRFGGVLCGAACPVVFMSRADDTATRLHSLALALAMESAGIKN
jgi:phosphotransacetylase